MENETLKILLKEVEKLGDALAKMSEQINALDARVESGLRTDRLETAMMKDELAVHKKKSTTSARSQSGLEMIWQP